MKQVNNVLLDVIMEPARADISGLSRKRFRDFHARSGPMVIQFMIVLVLAALPAGKGDERFLVESEFGKEAAWTEPFLNDAWKVLVRLMDNRKIEPPSGIHVSLKKDPDMGGIGGWATPESIGFTSNAWPKDKHRIWILAHELTNLFAAHYGGAGGYPADWWANGRSPFPEYVSCLVMEELGYREAAEHRKAGMQSKPDHMLYWKLHAKHGFELFARFFKLVNADGLDMGLVGKPWPHPDEARSAYTMAYLSMAAGENIAGLCREHGIGAEPDDWKRIHPSIPFEPYSVTAEEVEGVMAVRAHLFDRRSRGPGVEILRDLFRKGRTYQPSAEPEDGSTAGADEDMPTGADALPASDSIAFDVRSEFGAESAWTEDFLVRTAAALVEVLEMDTSSLPARVPVHLRKVADLGGISGGATSSAIDLISDSWPEEPFRRWILSQELARLIGSHLGGKLPEYWWGHGNKPFAAYASVLALEKMGFAGEADWVRDMHRDKPDHEFFWSLHERAGSGWTSRFFRLLREDGIEFEILGRGADHPQRTRSLYLIVYLSLACGENLATLCSEHGIGTKPAGWDEWNPDLPFEPYRITAAEVDALMERRQELFGAEKDTPALLSQRKRFRRGEE
jgi:hypothetical protein